MPETLLHFTGRNKSAAEAFSALTSICTTQTLWLSYCPIFAKELFEKPISMACFADLDLSAIVSHAKTFGSFAAAFNRKALIGYGANPVFYATPTHYDKFRDQFKLLAKMEDLEKDREWKDVAEPYGFTEDETVSLQAVSGFLQEYAYKKDVTRLNYNQREWRLSFRTLPFAGQGKAQLPGMSCFITKNGKPIGTMKFAPADLEYIVVPKRYKVQGAKLAAAIGKPCRII